MRKFTLCFVTIVGMICTISCRTSSTMVSTDTIRVLAHEAHTSVLIDSVYVLDSVFVSARNCTITQNRIRTQWRIIRDVRHDTIHDTLYRNRESEKTTTKERSTFPYFKLLCVVLFGLPYIFMFYNIFRHFSTK